MKKKTMRMLSAALAVTLLSGCGAAQTNTPAETSVNQAMLLEKSAQPQESAYTFPEKFTGDWTGQEGKLTIHADAQVVAELGTALPTATVEPREFTQEDVDNLLKVLLKGEPLYGFNSAQKYLMTAAVSENGNYMAAAAMGQDGGSFTSSLQIYKLTSDALQADAALSGGVYELGTVDGRFCAATDKALCFVKADGSVRTYDYQGANLARCSINGGKFAAVLLENYSSGGLTHLATVNTAGEEIAALTVDSQVLDLSAAGRYVAVLYTSSLVIYDRNLRQCAVLEDVNFARRVLMRSDGSAVLAGTNSASLYLP